MATKIYAISSDLIIIFPKIVVVAPLLVSIILRIISRSTGPIHAVRGLEVYVSTIVGNLADLACIVSLVALVVRIIEIWVHLLLLLVWVLFETLLCTIINKVLALIIILPGRQHLYNHGQTL